MPFLRVVRDKRGYETTYLIHSPREGSHQGSRVLYAFRSPGGVRVGRDPFEPSVRREIEAGNPGIAFDWDTLLSGQHVIDATPEQRRPRRREGPPPPPPVSRRAEPPSHTPRLSVPGAIEGDTPEKRMRFLANWHGILCEQLPERVADPVRREALMTLAQRLNPAGWIDADEIAAGVQQASEALEQLSRILSKRRRKQRRSGPREGQAVADLQADPQADQEPESERVDELRPEAADDSRLPSEGTDFAPDEETADGETDPA